MEKGSTTSMSLKSLSIALLSHFSTKGVIVLARVCMCVMVVDEEWRLFQRPALSPTAMIDLISQAKEPM